MQIIIVYLNVLLEIIYIIHKVYENSKFNVKRNARIRIFRY